MIMKNLRVTLIVLFLTVTLLTAFQWNSMGQQPIIQVDETGVQLPLAKRRLPQHPPEEEPDGGLGQQQVQTDQPSIRAVKPQPRQLQEVKPEMAEEKIKNLRPVPVIPPPDPQMVQQRLPEYPQEEEPDKGIGQQEKPSGNNNTRPPCFIATAAYGTPLAEKVIVLQRFRDEYLLTNPFGRWFVASYYKYSPPLADYIARHEMLRLATRATLWPIVFCIQNAMRIMAFLLISGTTVGVYAYCRKNERCRNGL